MNLLVIETSPRGKESASKDVTSHLVERLSRTHDGILIRDLASHPLPHLNSEMIEAYFTAPDQHTVKHKNLLTNSEAIIEEVMAADTIVISSPMWNFGLPSSLKAWLDHLSRAGRTFSFDSNGPRGLIDSKKKVYFIISSGSRFSSGPFAAWDMAVPSLRTALAFLGLTNFELIRVEGTNDPVSRASAITNAKQTIEQLTA